MGWSDSYRRRSGRRGQEWWVENGPGNSVGGWATLHIHYQFALNGQSASVSWSIILTWSPFSEEDCPIISNIRLRLCVITRAFILPRSWFKSLIPNTLHFVKTHKMEVVIVIWASVFSWIVSSRKSFDVFPIKAMFLRQYVMAVDRNCKLSIWLIQLWSPIM